MDNPSKKGGKFVKIFFIFVILTLTILAIIFFISSIILNENFFLKYSADKFLKESTINKINIFQNILLYFSSFLLLTSLILILFRKQTYIIIDRYNKFLKNILLCFIVIIILFSFLEIFFRIMYYDVTVGPLFGPASLRFNEKYVHLNDDGYRDYEFSIDKDPNIKRIVVLGDSFTFGSGIKDSNNTFIKLFEKNINENDMYKEYEIYNLAIPGESTKTLHDKLQSDEIWKYNPDIVMIVYNINDIESLNKSQPSHITIIPFVGFFLRNFSYTYLFFEIKMNRLYENIGYKKTQTQNFIDRYNSEQDTKYHKQLLVNISDKSKENEVQVILVIFPLLYDFENYDFYGAHQFISEIGEENNMQVIDLLYAFQNEDPKELILSKYDSHPNEKANYIAAEFITTRFINNCSINQTCQITNQ